MITQKQSFANQFEVLKRVCELGGISENPVVSTQITLIGDLIENNKRFKGPKVEEVQSAIYQLIGLVSTHIEGSNNV